MTGGPEGRCAQAFTLRVMREELAQRHCSPSWKPSPICSTRSCTRTVVSESGSEPSVIQVIVSFMAQGLMRVARSAASAQARQARRMAEITAQKARAASISAVASPFGSV